MANQQVSYLNEDCLEQPFGSHRNFCEENQVFETSNLSSKKVWFSTGNTDLVLTYNVS